MAFANVFLGNIPGDGTGATLREAFNTINRNFANLAAINGNANVVVYATGNARVTATYNPGVESIVVNGIPRKGNISLTVNDIIGAPSVGYVVNYVNTRIAAIPAASSNVAWANVTNKPTFSTIATTGSWNSLVNVPLNVTGAVTQTNINSSLIPVNANIEAANVQIAVLSGRANTAVSNAALQQTQINSLRVDVNANANVVLAHTSAINTLNANIGAYETWANATFGTSNYSDASVAAYLIAQPPAGTYSNANVTAYLVANPQGSTYSNANVTAYLVANPQGSTYSNANVTAYLVATPPTGTYSNANVSSYLVANPAAGTYSNVNVAAYLTIATINTAGNITAGSVRSNGNIAMTSNVARNVYVNSYAPGPTQGNVGDIWYQTY
jgi:hypothetical protein